MSIPPTASRLSRCHPARSGVAYAPNGIGILMLPGQGRRGYVEPEMLPGEFVTLTKPANFQPHGGGMGGDLILTNYRVLFRPFNLRPAIVILKLMVHFAPGHGVGTVCKLALRYAAEFNAQFGELASWADSASLANVYPGQSAHGMRIPTLVLEYTDGKQAEVGITGSMWTVRGLASDDHRDEMVNAILAQLQAN